MHFIYSYNEVLLRAHIAMSIKIIGPDYPANRGLLLDQRPTKIKTYFSLKPSESLLD